MSSLKNCCNALSRALTPRPARNEPGGNNAGGGPGALSVPAHVLVRSAPLLALTSLASRTDEPGERSPVVFHAAQAPRSIVAAPHRQNRFVQLAMLKALLQHLRTFLPGRDSLNLRSTWKGAPMHMPMHMPLSAGIARARALLEPIALAQNRVVEATKAYGTTGDWSGLARAGKSLANARNKIDTDAVGFLLGMGFDSADQENLVKCDRWLRNLQVGEGKEIKYPEVERVMREMNLPAYQVNNMKLFFQTLLVPDLPGAKRLDTLESLNTAVSALRGEIVLVAQYSLTHGTTRSSSPPYPGCEEVTYRRSVNGFEQKHTHGGPDPYVHRFIFRDLNDELAGIHFHEFNDPNAPADNS
jgi:hypothetical protein